MPTIDHMDTSLMRSLSEDEYASCRLVSAIGMTLLSNQEFQRLRKSSEALRHETIEQIESKLDLSLPISAGEDLIVRFELPLISILGRHALMGSVPELSVASDHPVLVEEQAAIYNALSKIAEKDFTPEAPPHMSIVSFQKEVPGQAWTAWDSQQGRLIPLNPILYSNHDQTRLEA